MTLNNLEDLLAHIGNANRFQVIMFFFIMTPAIYVTWTLFEMSYVVTEPDWCCVPKHIQDPDDYCHGGNSSFTKQCPDDFANCTYRFYDDGMNTMVNEWNLVCGDSWKVDLSTSVQMAGVLLGSVIAGFAADVFGRKKIYYFSVNSLAVFSILAGFTPTVETFAVLRVCLGISCGMYLVVSLPYTMEFLSPSHRELPSIVPSYTIGGCLLTLTAWLLHDWRWVHWVCGALMLPFMFSWFFIPESLRWLTVKGKLDQAEKVVAFIARVNRREVPEGCREVIEEVYKQEQKVKDAGKESYTYLDIYRGWDLFRISVSLQLIWLALSFISYGVIFGASTLGLNVYLNIFLLSVSYLPVLIFMKPLMRRFGRKAVAIVLMGGATISGFGALAVYKLVSDEDTRNLTTNILCLAANGLSGGSWLAVMVINNEAYPTVLRSLGFGAANSVSRLGGILAPFAFSFASRPVMSYALLGGTMCVSTLLLLLLNETYGLALTDTMQEAEVAREIVAKRDSLSIANLLGPSGERKRRNTYGGIGYTDEKADPNAAEVENWREKYTFSI